MNEPTLGQRIADAAVGWQMADMDHGAGSYAALDAWAELLTLCECADAAERLATAAASHHAPTHPRSPADASTDAAGLVAALDAWLGAGNE